MKMKHNKKRNTAFIFEVLIRELTKTIIHKDDKKKKFIMTLIREHFKGNTLLAKDLDLYKAILETKNVDKNTAQRVVFEARMQKSTINHKVLFEEQSALITKIHKHVSPKIFSNSL